MTPTHKLQRLLLAGTVLSTMAWLQPTESTAETAAPARVQAAGGDTAGGETAGGGTGAIILAQAPPPDAEPKRPPGAPKQPPAEPKKPPTPPPAPPAVRPTPPPPPPVTRPAPPPPQPPAPPPARTAPPQVQPSAPPRPTPPPPPPPPVVRPTPPAVQAPPPPSRPTPPAVAPTTPQNTPTTEPKRPPGPPRPPGEQKRPPGPPASPPTPPTTAPTTAPSTAPNAAPTTPPGRSQTVPNVPGRPVGPPPARTAPNGPPPNGVAPNGAVPAPNVQGQPPAVPGRPVAPPTPPGSSPGVKTAPATGPGAPPPPGGTPPGATPPAPPTGPGTPPGPNSGVKGPPGPTAPGAVPNREAAPLTRSGVPAPNVQAVPIVPAGPGAGISPQTSGGQPIRRIDELRGERRETRDGNRTIIREPDRTIIREGNTTIIRHDEGDRFRYGARDVRTERRGNENVTTVIRPGGDRVVTVVDENGFLVRRSRFLPDGREIVIIDNRGPGRGPGYDPRRGFGGFVVDLPPPVVRIPRDRYIVEADSAPPELMYQTLMAPPVERIERRYSLDEIRYTAPLRDRMSRIDINTVTFDTGSWELAPTQVNALSVIADALNRAIQANPAASFLIEGYTDAVGNDVDNLSLSDRRAQSVAIALTQQFNVPAENLSTQGYGEQYLKVPTQEAERANRRVTVRNITPLLTGQAQ